jgi:hypothetical protein
MISFPLTPTLSLGERENPSPPFSITYDWICSGRLGKSENMSWWFLLPKGEG